MKIRFGDGCTFFPDRWFGVDLSLECQEHDIAYTIGGTQDDKDRADRRLAMRVYKKLREAGHSALASRLMWLGVRIGGGNRFNYHGE